jgi:vacuolar-type H+-ATPase subunit C/Vma6
MDKKETRALTIASMSVMSRPLSLLSKVNPTTLFYAYVKLEQEQQEIRNLVWISECIRQQQNRDEIKLVSAE